MEHQIEFKLARAAKYAEQRMQNRSNQSYHDTFQEGTAPSIEDKSTTVTAAELLEAMDEPIRKDRDGGAAAVALGNAIQITKRHTALLMLLSRPSPKPKRGCWRLPVPCAK